MLVKKKGVKDMYSVDLNSDMGESFGAYKLGGDEDIIQYVTTANVACGWHAGDPMVMDKVAPKRQASRLVHIRDFRISWDLDAGRWYYPSRK